VQSRGYYDGSFVWVSESKSIGSSIRSVPNSYCSDQTWQVAACWGCLAEDYSACQSKVKGFLVDIAAILSYIDPSWSLPMVIPSIDENSKLTSRWPLSRFQVLEKESGRKIVYVKQLHPISSAVRYEDRRMIDKSTKKADDRFTPASSALRAKKTV